MAGVAVVTAGTILWFQQHPETATPIIQLPLPQTKTQQQANEDIKPSAPATSSEFLTQIPSDKIQLQFSQASWVQIVKINGQRQEKIYQAGSVLDIKPDELQALIIGNAQGVSVHAGSSKISLKPYISSGNNVARIIGESLRRLNQ